MSYPRDLDEISMEELEREVARRRELRAFELCDYCARPYSAPPCKFPERHRAPGTGDLATVCKGGCNFTKRACDQAKALGKVACCPECSH